MTGVIGREESYDEQLRRYNQGEYARRVYVEHESKQQPFVRMDKRVGRNDFCPCQSGLKYKKCHLQVRS